MSPIRKSLIPNRKRNPLKSHFLYTLPCRRDSLRRALPAGEGEDMKETKERPKPRVIHVMADGTVKDSIEGHVIPADNGIYDLIARMNKKREEKKSPA